MVSYYGRYVLGGAFAIVDLYGDWRMRQRIVWARPEGWAWLGTLDVPRTMSYLPDFA